MEAMDLSFWKGKRVFVTGHTGFKGAWLSLWLQHLGAKVHGFALPPATEPNLFELAAVAGGMTSGIGDVRDTMALRAAVKQCRPEVVFHLAAQALVSEGYADPVATYATNVMGTVNLFDAIRHTSGVHAIVNITSDKCYENREWAWPYREDDALGGHDPYANSKACAELVTAAYRDSFFSANAEKSETPAIATARAGNVIGGGDWSRDRLVPDLIRAFVAGKPALLRQPKAVRPWQHVLEPLAGYLLLAQQLGEGRRDHASAWNFGPSEADHRGVAYVAERIAALWAETARCEIDSGSFPYETQLLRIDASKARQKLGWTPRWNLDQTLEYTTSWYRAWHDGRTMRDETVAQINAYQHHT